MSNRKRYIIINTNTQPGKLPTILSGGEDTVIGETHEEHALLTTEECKAMADKYDRGWHTPAVFSRRAVVRRALQKIRALDSRWSRNHAEHLRIVEIGEFKRDVRPVKHWNIESKYRKRGKVLGRARPWSESGVWSRGIQLREEARKIAADLTESHKTDGLHEIKFRAVPVYAD